MREGGGDGQRQSWRQEHSQGTGREPGEGVGGGAACAHALDGASAHRQPRWPTRTLSSVSVPVPSPGAAWQPRHRMEPLPGSRRAARALLGLQQPRHFLQPLPHRPPRPGGRHRLSPWTLSPKQASRLMSSIWGLTAAISRAPRSSAPADTLDRELTVAAGGGVRGSWGLGWGPSAGSSSGSGSVSAASLGPSPCVSSPRPGRPGPCRHPPPRQRRAAGGTLSTGLHVPAQGHPK